MTRPDRADSLSRLWDDVPVGAPPLADLVREGTSLRRRHRLRVTAGAAVLVAGVMAGSAVATGTVLGTDPSPRPDHVVAAEVPTAPPGQRLVGLGRVVVAVPVGWGTNYLDFCGLPSAATVWFPPEDRPGTLECDSAPRRVPSAKLTTLDTLDGLAARRIATRESVVDGVQVLRGLAPCRRVGLCAGATVTRFLVVPSLDVALILSGPERTAETLDEVAASIRILPEGWTTVPFVAGSNPAAWDVALSEVGLEEDSRFTCPDTGICVTTPRVDPRPGVGEVAQVGSTVDLYPSG